MPKEDFLSALDCLDLREAGYPQGKSTYLWLRDRQYKDKWSLYKRNPYDNSNKGDLLGYNRWVSAVTVKMAQAWQDSKPKPPPELHVTSLTFAEPRAKDPRKSAGIFATTCRDRLINITEVLRDMGVQSPERLEVTVYFWKEE